MVKINLDKIVKEISPNGFYKGQKVRLLIDYEMNSSILEVREGIVEDPNHKRCRGKREINALQIRISRSGKLSSNGELDYTQGHRPTIKGRVLGKPYLESLMYDHIVGFQTLD